MDTKHTPGPWVMRHTPGAVGTDGIVGKLVAICYGDDPECSPDERMHANARLIAAAPELLEALEAAVECGLVPISSAREGGASTHSRQVQVADLIRDAIAKARG